MEHLLYILSYSRMNLQVCWMERVSFGTFLHWWKLVRLLWGFVPSRQQMCQSTLLGSATATGKEETVSTMWRLNLFWADEWPCEMPIIDRRKPFQSHCPRESPRKPHVETSSRGRCPIAKFTGTRGTETSLWLTFKSLRHRSADV